MGRKRKRNNEDSQEDDVNFIDDDSKPAIERNAANERERARMRVLSRAFHKLKTSLPWVPPDTKLSKLDTLRLASCYIAHLSRLLAEDGDEGAAATVRALSLTDNTSQLVKNIVSPRLPDENFTTTTKLTWPFSLPTMRSSQLESVLTAQEIVPY